MQAELIAVGTELLLGHTIDTDSAFASRELAAAGVDVLRRFTVGDNPDRLEQTLRLALSQSGLVILIGGLGPTKDDLTKEIAAAVCGKQFSFSDSAAHSTVYNSPASTFRRIETSAASSGSAPASVLYSAAMCA